MGEISSWTFLLFNGVLDALTLAVWRRRPKGSVIIHSDQGSQFGSDEFSLWCNENRLSPIMSRKGNCWDNAVAESFLSNLKSEKIKKKIYKTRQEAGSEVFEYIEGFNNPVRRHKHLDQLSTLEFERRPLRGILDSCKITKANHRNLSITLCTAAKLHSKWIKRR